MNKKISFLGQKRTVKLSTVSEAVSIMKSVVGSTNNPDDLEKGIVTDMFRYGDKSDFSVSKKGSELISAINAMVVGIQAGIDTISASLPAMISEIGVEPDEDLSEYNYDGLSGILTAMKEYSYAVRDAAALEHRSINRNSGMVQSEVSSYKDPYSDKDSSCYKMSRYNSSVRSMIQKMVEKRYAEAFSSSVDSGKTYKLPIRLAAILEFK